MSWQVIQTDGGIHIIPERDSHAHDMTEQCECHPQMNDDGFVVHNSYDERERNEPDNEKATRH